MAENRRILFPLLSQTNQTLNCSSGFCDSVCPYNCYPDFDYYPPSPPIPAFPQLPPQSPEFPQPPQDDRIDQISSNVIIIVAVASVLSFFLLVGIYLAAKLSSHGRNRNGFRRDPNRDIEEFLDENRIDHPIWFIRTVGLQQSVINSITIWSYKKDENLIEGTHCSVCLNEFQESEYLRVLPKCNHAFHISCIDTWLRSHTNCPLCRTQIVPNSIRVNAVSFEANLRNGFDQTQRSDDAADGGSLEMNVGESETMDEELVIEREEGEYSKEAMESNQDCFLISDQNSNAQIENLDLFEDSNARNQIVQTRMESFSLLEGSDQNQEVLNPDEEHSLILNQKGCDQNHEPLNSDEDDSLDSIKFEHTQMKRFDLSERLGSKSDDSSNSIQNMNTHVKDSGSCEEDEEVLDDQILELGEIEGKSTNEATGNSSEKLKMSGTGSVSKLLHRGPVSMKKSVACGRRNNKRLNPFVSP